MNRALTIRSLRQTTGWLLLGLFVLLQSFGVAHHALVRHETCAVDGQTAHADHCTDGESESFGEHLEAGGGPGESSGGHHAVHCSVPDTAEIVEVNWPPASWIRLDQSDTVERRMEPSTEIGIPVFLYAPKNSPPATISQLG